SPSYEVLFNISPREIPISATRVLAYDDAIAARSEPKGLSPASWSGARGINRLNAAIRKAKRMAALYVAAVRFIPNPDPDICAFRLSQRVETSWLDWRRQCDRSRVPHNAPHSEVAKRSAAVCALVPPSDCRVGMDQAAFEGNASMRD